mgnify:CR=1 FL=1
MMAVFTPAVIGELIVIGFTFFMLLNSAAVLVYLERKVAAFVQQRYGPYLVGPYGLLQPMADIVKLMFKEELRPKAADTILFYAAPILSAAAAFSAFAVVPFGADTDFFGLLDRPIHLAAADVNGDGIDDVITAKGPGSTPTVRVYQVGVVNPQTHSLEPTLQEIRHQDVLDAAFGFGIFVGASN